jgi:hypothetical protein
MSKKLEIEPGIGIGEFRFGLTRDALQEKKGVPDEKEKNDEGVEDEGEIEVWHYDEDDISIEFIEGNDWRLSTIAVSSEECTLGGVTLIGKSQNEVTSLLDALKLGEYESEKLDLDNSHEIVLLSVFDAGLNFWFEAGQLTEIQLMPDEE